MIDKSYYKYHWKHSQSNNGPEKWISKFTNTFGPLDPSSSKRCRICSYQYLTPTRKFFTKVVTSKRAFCFSLFFSKSDFKKVHWRTWVTGGGRRAWTEVHRRKLSPMIGDLVFRNLKLLHRRGNELLSRVLIWKRICRRKLSIFPSPLDSLTRSLYLSSSFIQFCCVHFLDFRDLLSWSWVLGYER